MAKFCASALAALAVAKKAPSVIRREAAEALMDSMARWQVSPNDPATEGETICECSCETPAMAATCFLERLFARADAVTTEALANYPRLGQLVTNLFFVVSRQGGNPFAVTHLLRLKGGASMLAAAPRNAVAEWRTGAPLDAAIALAACMLDTLEDSGSQEEVVAALDSVLDSEPPRGLEAEVAGVSFGAGLILRNHASVPLLVSMCKLAAKAEGAHRFLQKLAAFEAGRECLRALSREFQIGMDPSSKVAAVEEVDESQFFLDGQHLRRTWASFDPAEAPEDAELIPLVGRSLHTSMPGDEPEPYGPPWLHWKRRLKGAPTAKEWLMLRGENPNRWPQGVWTPERDLATAYSVLDALAVGCSSDAEAADIGAKMAALVTDMSLREKRVWLWRQIRRPTAARGGSGDVGSGGVDQREGVSGGGSSQQQSDVGDEDDNTRSVVSEAASPASGSSLSEEEEPESPSDRWREERWRSDDDTSSHEEYEHSSAESSAESESDWEDDASSAASSEGFTFVECDRTSTTTVLEGLRTQMLENTGVRGDPLVDLEVAFTGESSAGSAVVREWLSVTTDALTSAEAGIFCSQDGGRTFRPSAAAFPQPQLELERSRLAKRRVTAEVLQREALELFEIQGRVLGFALAHQEYIPLRLNEAWAKLLLRDGESWIATDDEIKAFDETFFRAKVRFLMENEIDDLLLGLDWTEAVEDAHAEAAEVGEGGEEDDEGRTVEEKAAAEEVARLRRLRCACRVPLSPPEGASDAHAAAYAAWSERAYPLGSHPDGACTAEAVRLAEELEVCDANKMEYLVRSVRWRMFGSTAAATEAFLKGLHVAVPGPVLRRLASVATPAEFCDMIAGVSTIDVDDWKANSQYGAGLSAESSVVRWFWATVYEDMNERQRRLLLSFATGSSLVPVGGFAELHGHAGGVHAFTLMDGAHLPPDALPSAHACVCTVDLPAYSSRKVLRERLIAAVEFGSAGFDEAAVAGAGGVSDDEQ